MKNLLINLFAAALVANCGGGDETVTPLATTGGTSSVSAAPTGPALPPAVQFEAKYQFISPDFYPNGTVDIYPPTGLLAIRSGSVAKVELLLFGEDRQELLKPNFSPKDNPQLHYVFGVPASFKAGAYACGTGQFLSEIRVTDVDGTVLSKTFELCPGVPSEVSASF